PRKGQSHHYAFHVSEAEFEAIFTRVKAKGIPYGSGPHSHTDGQINTRRGGRGFYFEDPYGHLLEVMTVPETGNEAELLENPSRSRFVACSTASSSAFTAVSCPVSASFSLPSAVRASETSRRAPSTACSY